MRDSNIQPAVILFHTSHAPHDDGDGHDENYYHDACGGEDDGDGDEAEKKTTEWL